MKRFISLVMLLVAVGAALYSFGKSRSEAVDDVERYVNKLSEELPLRAIDFGGDLRSVKLDRKGGKVIYTFTDVRNIKELEGNVEADEYLMNMTLAPDVVDAETLAKCRLALEYVFITTGGNTVTYTVSPNKVAAVAEHWGEASWAVTSASWASAAPASWASAAPASWASAVPASGYNKASIVSRAVPVR